MDDISLSWVEDKVVLVGPNERAKTVQPRPSGETWSWMKEARWGSDHAHRRILKDNSAEFSNDDTTGMVDPVFS